jgi:hypothetical protein
MFVSDWNIKVLYIGAGVCSGTVGW